MDTRGKISVSVKENRKKIEKRDPSQKVTKGTQALDEEIDSWYIMAMSVSIR